MNKEWPVEKIAISFLLLVLAAMVLLGYSYPVRFYGLSLPADYHPAVGLAFVLFSLAGLLPAVRHRIVSFLQSACDPDEKPLFRSSHIFIFSLVAAVFTLVCPNVNPMMGDGPIYLYDVDQYYSPDEFMFGIKTPFCILDTALHHLLFLATGKELYPYLSSSTRAYFVWSMVSAVGTFVFFIFLFRVIPVLTPDRSRAKALTAVALTLGTMAIFSGYIEYISLRVALLMIYLWVAVRMKRPEAARAVGQALGRNPLAIIVPCHRVVASSGKLGGFGGGVEMKRYLLRLEASSN